MGNKTAVIEEIRLRLVAGIVSGQPLDTVKRIRVGSIEEARKQNDFPIINIDVLQGQENYYYASHGKTDTMDLEITFICNKLSAEYNALYALSGSTYSGPLYLLERILNVLDKNTSGVVDLSLNSKGNNLAKYSYEVKSSPTFWEMPIRFQVETAQFTAGAR